MRKQLISFATHTRRSTHATQQYNQAIHLRKPSKEETYKQFEVDLTVDSSSN